MVVGSSQKRGSDQALCVHTAGFKGITRAQRTAGGPREPSSLDLFIPRKIGRVSLWYLSAASRYATMHRVWAYFQARLAFTLAAFNVLVQWHGFQPNASGFVPLSIAEFSL